MKEITEILEEKEWTMTKKTDEQTDGVTEMMTQTIVTLIQTDREKEKSLKEREVDGKTETEEMIAQTEKKPKDRLVVTEGQTEMMNKHTSTLLREEGKKNRDIVLPPR